jgi:hypothetical protein
VASFSVIRQLAATGPLAQHFSPLQDKSGNATKVSLFSAGLLGIL